MRRNRFLFLSLCSIVIVVTSAASPLSSPSARGSRVPSDSATSPHERIAEQYGNLPIGFEPNRRQFDSQVRFGTRDIGFGVFLNSTGATIKLPSSQRSEGKNKLEIALRGANPDTVLRSTDRLPGEANYFAGAQETWITHVPTYRRITGQDVYPGIDVAYYGNQGHLEYDFIVHPGASPEVIQIAF